MNTEYRINYFKQIKDFYSLIYNTDYNIRPVHISLYMFLLNQNNRNNWVEWFKCPFDLAMAGACINSKNTYYKTLDDLKFFNLIEYKKGINLFKAPKIKILPIKEVSSVLNNDTLTEHVTVPQSEPLSVPQSEPLSVLLNKNIYKLITDNYKIINKNNKEICDFLNNLGLGKKENNTYREFDHLSISIEEFNKLNEEYDKEVIDGVLDSIENYKDNKKYKSLYLTSKQWLKKEPKKIINENGIGRTNQKLMKYGKDKF